MAARSARFRALALVFVAALGFAMVPAGVAHASGPGSATFTITADGAPASGTSVFLSGPDFAFGGTDGTGQVAFSDLALGDYTLTVPSSSEYQEVSVAFSLTAESPHFEQVIPLSQWPTGTGAISGTVVDSASGDPLSDITVQVNLIFEPGPVLQVSTNSSGEYSVGDLPAGRYAVAVPFAPGYFSVYSETEIAEGGTETVDLALLAADSAITGRVVDPEGNGVAGLWVGASTVSGSSGGSTGAQQTDGDGYYTLTGAGEGLWEVSAGADTNWEPASVTVQVEAASTATAPDLVLVPRFTGTIAGLVASSDGIPESQSGGFFDVCVTVLDPGGNPVPGANTVTGGDSFYFFWLAPGDYTAIFEDCDPDREPHGYQSTYLGGTTTLAEATIVTVETNVEVWLDTTTLEPQASFPEPDYDATPVRTRDLDAADEDLIDAPSMLRRGETAEVIVGTEYAGQWVSAWLHSRPTPLGEWHQVSPEGTIEITVPRLHPLGIHELVVQDADDAVIGWAELRVRQRVK